GLKIRSTAISLFQTFAKHSRSDCSLLSPEMATSVQQNLQRILDSWKTELRDSLRDYLRGKFMGSEDNERLKKLTSYLTLMDLPVVVSAHSSSLSPPNELKINPLEWILSMKGSMPIIYT
ncbi:Shattered, partial [Caligus rogercresseyi]